MVRNVMLCIVLLVFVYGNGFADTKVLPRVRVDTSSPRIQLAILLDTSGSMSGLIDQARTELWAVVNEFITVKQNGKAPELDVALYEYGKSALPQKEGYIRKIVGFSNDLDKVSQELFALKTNGGSEYCGWVIQDAVKQLDWSQAANDLKVIFIAGNEPFTQGPVDYKESCKAAIEKGIIVNTIHCGSLEQGISGKWKDGALVADGSYLCINHNRKAVEISAPQDAEIVKLSEELNDTYIAYGREGARYKKNQVAQDRNSSSISISNMAQRAATKSSRYYRNDKWDIVDAMKDGKVKLEEMESSELPKEMQTMDKSEQEKYVAEKAEKRAVIQKKIQKLNAERKEYIAAEMKKIAGADKSLGSAIIKAVRKQAESRKFEFQEVKIETKSEK